MKKPLILLIFILLANFIYSQNPSGTKPVVMTFDPGTNDYTSEYLAGNIYLGCGTATARVKASFVDDLGSTESYRIEKVDYNPKGYLPPKPSGNQYWTPSELGIPGSLIGLSGDDRWESVNSLNSIGFEFCYFGEPRDRFQTSTNSIVSFAADPRSSGTAYSGYSDWNLNAMGKIQPNANCGDNKDAILQMHDTDPNQPSILWDSYQFWAITGVPGERFFTLGIHHMPMYSCDNTVGYATHQMVFYETTNIIEFHIQDKPYCKTWYNAGSNIPGLQAFGLQNKNQTKGIAVPGLDNFEEPIQILDLNDGFYDSNFDGNVGVIEPKSYRFIPDGVLGIAPEFGWYLNWDDTTHTGTFVTSDLVLEVASTSIPTGGITYTAVVKYIEYCSGGAVYGTKNVSFDLTDPIQMHIVESQFIDDAGNIDPSEIETAIKDTVFLCGNDDYTLTANVVDSDPTLPYTLEWGVESFGNPYTILQTDNITTGDGNTTFFIDHTTITPGENYTYTCTLIYASCPPYSDTISVIAVNNASFEYIDDDSDPNNPYNFCASDTNPIPQNVYPVPASEDENYYYTISNGGVWANPLASDPTHSLYGVPNLSESLLNGNTDNTGVFVITYHAGCPDNTIDQIITITDAPIVLNPNAGDPSATPPIEPSPLITLCESSTGSGDAEFDLVAIDNYIANGSTGLQFDWVEFVSGLVIDNTNTAYSTSSKQVQVTVTKPSDPTACPVVLDFNLNVVSKPTISTPTLNLKQCENGSPIETAPFFGTLLEDKLLNNQNPANYTIHYSAIDVDGNPVTQIYVSGVAQNFESPLPATFNVQSVTVTAFITQITDTTNSCPSDEVTFNLIVKEIPLVKPPTDGIVMCETDTTNHTSEFDTSNWNTYILSDNPTPINTDFVLEFDYVDEFGASVTGVSSLPNPFTSTSQTIKVRAINAPSGSDPCPSQDYDITLSVIQTPTATQLTDTAITPLTLCEDDTNTDVTVHTALFDTTQWNTTILGSQTASNYSVEYTYVDINGTTIITETLPANLELSSQTISAKVLYEVNTTTDCESSVSTFNVEVKNTPIIADLPATDIITKCETDDVNHTAEFDTTTWDNTILGGTQPSANFYVTYSAFIVEADGTETTFPLTYPLPATITTKDLKVYATVNYDINATITCNSNTNAPTDTGVFYLNVIEKPIATPLVNTVSDPVSSDDVAIILCETNTTNHRAEFDTTNWNKYVLGRPTIQTEPEYTVEYTAFTVDSGTGVETPFPLPSPFPEASNISTLPSLKIYAKALFEINSTTQCEGDIISFFIESNPSPSIVVPTDTGFPSGSETLEMCESDTDTNPDVHMATFDTTNWNNIIFDGQTGTNYHIILTAVDLNGDIVTLPNPLPTNFETSSIIISATVTDDNIPCDSPTKEFKLVVKEIPINNQIDEIIQCEDDSNIDPNYHTSVFDTSQWTSTVIGTQDAADLVVEYTYNLLNGTTVTVKDGASITSTLPVTIESKTQSVSVIIKNITTTITCFDSTPKTFDLTVINTPFYVAQNDIVQCEDDTDSDLTIHTSGFDTTSWNTDILGTQTQSQFSVEYTAFTLDSGGTEIPYTLPNPLPVILDVPSITIKYVVRYNIDSTTYCESITPAANPNENEFDLIVRLIPFIDQLEDDMDTTGLVNLEICEDDTDSDPTFHTALFDTNNWNKTILKDNYDNSVTPPTINSDFIIEYYYKDINDVDQIALSTSLPDPFELKTQTIKYIVKNITVGEDTCESEEKFFDVKVDLLPNGQNGNVVVCSGSQNYLNLNSSGELETFTFNNFAEPDTDNGNGDKNTYKWIAISDNPAVGGESISTTIPPTYIESGDNNPSITDTLINNTQVNQDVIYEVIPVSEFGCEGDAFYLTVTVEVAPNITDQTTTICNGDSVDFDLDVDTGTILTNNTYKWHAVENDNVEGETTVTDPEMDDVIINDIITNTSGEDQIVKYIVTPFSSGGCEGAKFSVFVTVNPRPDFELKQQYFICPEDGYSLIGEDINPDTYIYHWFEANDLNTEIGNTNDPNPKLLKVDEAMLTNSGGNYILTVEDKITHCVHTQFTNVSMAEQMNFGRIHVSDFNRPDNTITIEMEEEGDYEYTINYIDGNNYPQTITQTSPIFEHLVASTYQIEVVDLNNCSVTIVSEDVHVLDYPPFFTPNNDGDNDTWKITGSNFIPNSKIFILDRFGKVLYKVDPNSVLGWDGTYNGIQVPASDYWFTVEYIDPNNGEAKSVKGNFSIVRK